MKTKIINDRGRHYALVIDDPNKANSEKDVLAALSIYADSPCWLLVDIRLTKHHKPNPYAGSASAEDYRSHYEPKSPEESAYVKSRLREYTEEEGGSILWCTFDGIVRGEPTINGYKPPSCRGFDQAGYFSRAKGLKKLKEIQAFWGSIESLDDEWRIENPNRQPKKSVLEFEFRFRDFIGHEEIIVDNNDLGAGMS